MDWLYEIFEDYSRKISEGHRHEKYGEDTTSYAPSVSGLGTSMYETWSENKNEDIDRAIALSLFEEENQKGKSVIDNSFQWEEDEQLARDLQKSLNVESPPGYGNEVESPPRYGNEVESPPPYGNENTYQPPMPSYFPTEYRVCAGCNTEIGLFERSLNCLNAVWHPECLRCHACNLPISDDEFSTSGNYPYHKTCIKENNDLICHVCKHSLRTGFFGFFGWVEYKSQPFWNQKYCPSHVYDTPRCCCCDRFVAGGTRYKTLDDGRQLCLECLDSAIMGTDECQPLYLEVQEFFEGLDMKLEQQVPLHLVERGTLHEGREAETDIQGLFVGNAILILYGLPRLQTGSFIAHEMMHAWLRLQDDYQPLSPDVEEGICQVMAHMWLHSVRMSGSQFERTLWELCRFRIETDTSPDYGDGFRAGHRAVQKYGLRSTIDHIRATGTFPS